MPSNSVEIKGLKEVVKALKQLHPDVLAELKATHKAAAEDVTSAAKGKAPVRSGRLAGSIRPGVTQTSGVVRAGGARLPYAGVIHFGWPRHNIAPNPFLYDALDARRSEVVERYERAIQKIADQVG